MTRRRRRLRWWSFDDHVGNHWDVYLVIPSELPKEKGVRHQGLTRFGDHTILVSVGDTYHELADTTLHELMHVARGPETPEEPADEAFIQGSVAGMWVLMTALGMRLPELPNGFDALRARAKEEE